MTRILRGGRLALLTGLTLCACTLAGAGDWPGWLGPNQDGSSPEKGVFGKAAAAPVLEVTWDRALGIAYSGIAVAGGRAVTMFGDGDTDWLIAMNARTGEELWRYRIDRMFPKIGGAHGGQLGMPVIAGGLVYGLGAAGQLFAVRLADGSEVWSVRVDEQLGGLRPHFGFTTTPLVVAGLLFVQTGGPDGHSLTALDRKTGERVWSTGDEPVGYQSPIVAELGGRKQIIAVTNRSVMGLAPRDGTVLWRHEHGLVDRRDGWSTPIRIGDDSFVLTGGAESVAIRIRRDDGAHGVEELWRSNSLKNNFAMPVLHDGHLYGYDGSFMTCVDAASGKRAWKNRSDAAGLILVEGHLVIFDSEGDVVVAAASPDGYEEKARVKIDEEAGYTYPSFADGGVFVRNLQKIARVDIAAAASGR